MSWTKEREEKLRKLWKNGHSASQIASMLGETTRNAVIGKAHRLNLESRVTSKKTTNKKEERTYARPSWVPKTVTVEEELCPECFKVVGDRSRYKLVCMLGKSGEGMTVSALTKELKLTQPTVTHHLQVLRSVDAVEGTAAGRERIYKLNRSAHCFEECQIPY